jgi:hypothetical protein
MSDYLGPIREFLMILAFYIVCHFPTPTRSIY